MTFPCPFRLGGMTSEQPPGDYVVENDEELVDGLSFPAYRRTATYVHVPCVTNGVLSSEMVRVDPEELHAAVSAGPAATPDADTRRWTAR